MNVQEMWLQAQMQKQGGMPGPSNPALLAAAQHQTAPASHGNPLNAGALAAMHSTRQALSEKPKSQHGMMGGMLDSLGKTLQNVGIAKLRGSHRAPTAQLGGMMQTPDEMEEANYKKNADLLQFLSKQAEVQQQAEYRNAHLAEQRRYHDILAKGAAQKAASKTAKDAAQEISVPGLDLSQYPAMKTAKERNAYGSVLQGSNMALRSLKNVKGTFDSLKEKTKNNIFAPMGSVVPGVNPAKDYLARLSSGENAKDEMLLRKRLESQFARLEPVLEKGLKGTAAGEQLLKRFHNLQVYFNSDQPMELIEDKLTEIIKETQETINVSKLSLATGRHIDIIPGREEEAPPEPAAAQATPENDIISKVKSVNPALSQEAIMEAQRRLSGK